MALACPDQGANNPHRSSCQQKCILLSGRVSASSAMGTSQALHYFFTSDKRQASDIRGNSCTQTLSLEGVSHVAVPAWLSLRQGTRESTTGHVNASSQRPREMSMDLQGSFCFSFCLLEEPQVTQHLHLQKGYQHS